MNQLSVPVTISKADIPKYIALHGAVNSLPVVLNGATHPAKSLRFELFKGAVGEDLKYHGHYHFAQGNFAEPNQKLADLSALPGLKEPSDVILAHDHV